MSIDFSGEYNPNNPYSYIPPSMAGSILFYKSIQEAMLQMMMNGGMMGGMMPMMGMVPMFGGNNIWSQYNALGTFGGSSSSSKSKETEEEKDEKAKLKAKCTELRNVIKDYAKSLDNDKGKKILADLKKKDYTANTKDAFENLQKLYKEHKDGIQKFILGTDKFTEAGFDIKDGYNFSKKLIDNMKNTKDADYSDIMTGTDYDDAELSDDIDVLKLYSNLTNSTTKKSFKDLYATYKGSSDKQKANNRLFVAVGKAMKKKVEDLVDKSGVSESTNKKLKELKDAEFDEDLGAKDKKKRAYRWETLEKMYYWCRIAEAEILQEKYEELNDDYKNDEIFGEDALVKKAKEDMKTEISIYKPPTEDSKSDDKKDDDKKDDKKTKKK